MIDASSAAISTSVRFVGLRDRRYSRITCIPTNRNQFPLSDGWHNCVRVVRSSSPQKYDPYVQSAFGASAESERFRILWDSITVSVARGPRVIRPRYTSSHLATTYCAKKAILLTF